MKTTRIRSAQPKPSANQAGDLKYTEWFSHRYRSSKFDSFKSRPLQQKSVHLPESTPVTGFLIFPIPLCAENEVFMLIVDVLQVYTAHCVTANYAAKVSKKRNGWLFKNSSAHIHKNVTRICNVYLRK